MNLFFKKIKGFQPGFTLLEVLIAVAIFAIVFLIGVDLFITSTKTQRMTLVSTQLDADSRFSIESMAKDIRTGIIDYDYQYYKDEGSVPVPTEILALRDSDYNLIVYRYHNYNLEVCASGPCTHDPGGDKDGDFEVVNPTDIRIENLKFYIHPAVNPFKIGVDGNYLSNDQPRVTIVMSAQGSGSRPEEQKSIYLQTTVSSRIYKR